MSSSSRDWAAESADTIERLVGKVRHTATGPALTAINALKFGAIALFVGIVAAVLLAIGLVRLLDQLPGGSWVAHGLVGLLFGAVAVLLMSKASKAATREY